MLLTCPITTTMYTGAWADRPVDTSTFKSYYFIMNINNIHSFPTLYKINAAFLDFVDLVQYQLHSIFCDESDKLLSETKVYENKYVQMISIKSTLPR